RCYRDWSSDVCSSDLNFPLRVGPAGDRVDGIAHQLGLRAGNFSDDLITSIDDAIAGGVIHPLLTVDAHFDRRGRYTVRARIYVRSEERRVGKEWMYGA